MLEYHWKGKNPEKDSTKRCPLSKCSSKEVLEVVGRHYNTSGYNTYAQTSLSESVLECTDDSCGIGDILLACKSSEDSVPRTFPLFLYGGHDQRDHNFTRGKSNHPQQGQMTAFLYTQFHRKAPVPFWKKCIFKYLCIHHTSKKEKKVRNTAAVFKPEPFFRSSFTKDFLSISHLI